MNIKEIIKDKKDVNIFCMGEVGLLAYRVLKSIKINIKAIYDNDSTKWDQYIDGMPISNFKGNTGHQDLWLVATDHYFKDIRQQLLLNGISENLIIEFTKRSCREWFPRLSLNELKAQNTVILYGQEEELHRAKKAFAAHNKQVVANDLKSNSMEKLTDVIKQYINTDYIIVLATERYFDQWADFLLEADVEPNRIFRFGHYEYLSVLNEPLLKNEFDGLMIRQKIDYHPLNYRGLEQLNRAIMKNLHSLPADIDLVAGVPRSGLLPANLIALYLNLPLTDVDSLMDGRVYRKSIIRARKNWKQNIEECRKVMIVDDSVMSGRTIKSVKDKISGLDMEVLFFSPFVTEESKNQVDIYCEICPSPRVFEWNIMNHPIISFSCVDMDGVLCVDPTQEENDDGKNYIEFIKNAKPLFLPVFEIGYIVTSRLERYRKHTEEWLSKHGIQYKQLIMLGLDNKEQRIRLKIHARFKALIYSEIPQARLFIESSESQAEIIYEITGRQVFCIENHKMYMEENNVKA